MRREAEVTIERLLVLLDEMDGDPDVEESGDAEPCLGWLADGPSMRAGGADDREEDAGDEGEPDDENEPLLGSSPSLDQSMWSQGYGHLCDDHEPSLGWANAGSQLPHVLVGNGLLNPGATDRDCDREFDVGEAHEASS